MNGYISRRVGVGLISLMCGSGVARGADDYFIGTPQGGDVFWNDPGNWSLNAAPGSSDNAFLEQNDALSRTIELNVAASVSMFELGNTGGGVETFHQKDFDLTVSGTEALTGIYASSNYQTSSAQFIQDGSTNQSQKLLLGNTFYYGQSTGTYTLNNGTVISGTIQVGNDYGAAIFVQNSGTVLTGGINIRESLGAPCYYYLKGGFLQEDDLTGGEDASGTFVQTGGTHVITDELYLGRDGTGVYQLSGPSAILKCGIERPAGGGGFFQSAGENDAGTILLGLNAYGSFSISGGSLNVANQMEIGDLLGGSFAQTGGSITVGSPTGAGSINVRSSIYSMSGNSDTHLNVYGSENISSNSVFTQTGGTHSIIGQMVITGNSTVNFGGGTLLSPLETVGSTAANAGTSNFNQTGGLNKVGELYLSYSGIYTMSGGTLATSTISIDQGGQFNWTGGKLSATDLILNGSMTLKPGHDKALNVGSLEIQYAPHKLDLADNYLIETVTFGNPQEYEWGLRGYLSSSEIYSSVAAANQRIGYGDNAVLHRTTFGGVTLPNSSTQDEILAEMAYAGDVNLDGKVDIADLGILASHYGHSPGDFFWTDGDLNYDGLVNIADLGLLASNWGAGVTGPQSAESFQRALQAVGLTTVPEPAMIALFTLSGYLARPRRAK